jgi:hypothetical protein
MRQHGRRGGPQSPIPTRDNPPLMGPAGWVHRSLPDWAQFVALHLRAVQGQPALLKPQTFRKLHSGPGEDAGYTLGGWGLVKNHPRVKGVVLTHDGSNTMNCSAAWLALEPGFAVKPKYSARCGNYERVAPLSRSGSPSGWLGEVADLPPDSPKENPMMLYLGIDQHARQITISLRDESGDVQQARQVSTQPEKVYAFFQQLIRQRLPAGASFVAVLEVCGFNDWLIRLLFASTRSTTQCSPYFGATIHMTPSVRERLLLRKAVAKQ